MMPGVADAGHDEQDVEAPSREALFQGHDGLRFDDVEGLDLQPPAGAVRKFMERRPLRAARRSHYAPAPFEVLLHQAEPETARRADD